MNRTEKAIRRNAAQKRDALELLVQGRRTGGLRAGRMTLTDPSGKVRVVDPLPEHAFLSAARENENGEREGLTFHFGGGAHG